MIYDHTELEKQFEEEYASNSEAGLNWQYEFDNGWKSFTKNGKPGWWECAQYRRNPEATPISTVSKNRHKHYDLLVALAKGKTIKYVDVVLSQADTLDYLKSDILAKDLIIVPDVKPDTIVKAYIDTRGNHFLNSTPNVEFTFDGETDKLKKVELV